MLCSDPMTCSFLGGADQGSESRMRRFECWTSCAVEGVQLLVVRGSDETCGDSDKMRGT